MYRVLRNILTSNVILKICALFIGSGIWLLLGTMQFITRDIVVPLCFYNVPDNVIIRAQEEITVRLAGNRSELYTIGPNDITVQCDAQKLSVGRQIYRFGQDNFFLPSQVSMVHCKPSSCSIEVACTGL